MTRYDIELEQGLKLAKVTNLAGDLALALGVMNVRVAPIPNMVATVGIEVPNKIVSTVYLRDIIESRRFTSAKSKLSFCTGQGYRRRVHSRQHCKTTAYAYRRYDRLR